MYVPTNPPMTMIAETQSIAARSLEFNTTSICDAVCMCEDEKKDIINGFKLSGYFLKSCFYEYYSKNTPKPREWLFQLVSTLDG